VRSRRVSIAKPNNTLEAGILQAIMRGDAIELRILLAEGRGTSLLSANDVAIAERALGAIEVLGAEDATFLAGRYGSDFANTINHIFGNAAHKLGPLVKEFGSAEKAFVAAQRIVDAAFKAEGAVPKAIKLGQSTVRVNTAVGDGIAQIRTMYIP